MRILSARQRETTVRYERFYEDTERAGSGYGFPCDEHGVLAELDSTARANLERCQAEADRYLHRGVRRFEHSCTRPAVGVCDCGQHVQLGGFTNTCNGCGADYNRSGQRLAAREQWGEETGESPDDILRIP